jgi:hypothetical protein
MCGEQMSERKPLIASGGFGRNERINTKEKLKTPW